MSACLLGMKRHLRRYLAEKGPWSMLHSCWFLCALQGGDDQAVLDLLEPVVLSQNAAQPCLHHNPAFLLAGRRLLHIGSQHSAATSSGTVAHCLPCRTALQGRNNQATGVFALVTKHVLCNCTGQVFNLHVDGSSCTHNHLEYPCLLCLQGRLPPGSLMQSLPVPTDVLK